MGRCSGTVGAAFCVQVGGGCGPGGLRVAWGPLEGRDCGGLRLSAVSPRGGHAWGSGVGFAVRAASSYLEGGPLLFPLYLHVNKKSDYGDDIH